MSLPSTDQELAFHVNRHGVLSVPLIFWCALAFLARYWLLLFFVGLASRRDGGASQQLLSGGVSWSMLLGQSLIFLVLACAWQRQPNGAAWARWSWPRVPIILALVALFNAWWIWPVLSQPDNWQWGADLLLASCSLVDAAIVLALYRSPYYRHMFSEFPSPQSAALLATLGTAAQSEGTRGAVTDKQQNGT